MDMLNGGFLIVWNDVSPGIEDEYRRWHRLEHMPERLAIPGFSLGRRYVDPDGPQGRYLTVYEVNAPAVFTSDPYRQSLAAPTPWTRRMSDGMTNFVRRVCRTAASDGHAIGRAAATFRLALVVAADQTAVAAELVRAVLDMDAMVGAHVGIVDADVTGMRRDEMQTSGAAPGGDFNAVLIVECDSRETLAARLPALRETIAQITGSEPLTAQMHDLVLVFRPPGGRVHVGGRPS